MNIDKLVLLCGGFLLIIIDIFYFLTCFKEKICTNDEICYPAIFIIGIFAFGIIFIIYGVSRGKDG